MPKLIRTRLWGVLVFAGVLASAATLRAEPTHSSDDAEAAAPTEATADTAKPWYVGGTLHKATAAEWLAADVRNQLATAADWLLTSKEMKAKIEKSHDMNQVEPQADRVRLCVTRALHRHADLYAKMHANDVAMTCVLTLKQ